MNAPTQRFFYDGQMGMEDDSQWQTMNTFPNPPTQHHTVMRYGLGARGIDRMEYTNDSSSTSFAYPMYDGHGNMRAVINKSGSSYSTSNWRTYDVWGSVRTQSTSGDPKQRYCANLGHVADDETDLIYMRARYYEPNSGRFISQDRALVGANWYAYCGNNPITLADYSGEDPWSEFQDTWRAVESEFLKVWAAFRTNPDKMAVHGMVLALMAQLRNAVTYTITLQNALLDSALLSTDPRTAEAKYKLAEGMGIAAKAMYYAYDAQAFLMLFCLRSLGLWN